MENSIAVTTKSALPAVETNPWLEVANETGSELGRILRFVKGKYECGDDEVPLGTEFVAHLDQLARGCVKFAGESPSGELERLRTVTSRQNEQNWATMTRRNGRKT